MATVVTSFALLSAPQAPLRPPSCPGLLLGPAMLSGSPHGIAPGPPPEGHRAGGRGAWLCAAGRPGCLVQEGEGFSAEITRASSPEPGHAASRVPGHQAQAGACEEGAAGCPASGGSSPAPGGIRIPGRVCLKSLPPSLPAEELLPLNWRMLQAPADEPEESCGKVKASGEAACSCRVSPQPTAASRARSRPVSPPGP